MNPCNLIDFLTTHDLEELNQLRSEYPEAQDFFRWSRDLGTTDSAKMEIHLVPKIKLIATGIRTLRKRVDKITIQLTSRLKRSINLKMLGSGISAISSAGLVTSFAKIFPSENTVQIILAILAFLSSLLSIFSDRTAGGENGSKIREYFEETVSISSEILQVDLAYQRGDHDSQNVDKWLSILDDLALKLHRIEIQIGLI